ncbi:MAG: hypothetical protein MI724_17975 [Spirochaetales bacterium]|nr:hypothetical protein [Spirochaetales bacterium]
MSAVEPIAFRLEHAGPRCVGIGEYAGIMVQLIEAIKIRGRSRLLSFVAKEMVAPVLDYHFGSRPICPVPASGRGKRLRGFDQMRHLARYLPPEGAPALKRCKGREQKRLSKEDRLENARRSLTLRAGRNVPNSIVIDDVYTTGATLRRAAHILRDAGTPIAGALVLAIRR